jgi:hypothetical protein
MLFKVYTSLSSEGNNIIPGNGTKRGRYYKGFTLLLLALSFGIFDISASARMAIISSPGAARSYSVPTHGFYEHLFLGGSPSYPKEMPAPPSGEGLLKGQFTYQNKPAKGVTLSLTLNSEYEVDNLVTDEEGIFTVSLPTGKWHINSVQTESWEDKPEAGSFSLFYGGEEKLTGDSYNRHVFFGKGHAVDVTTDTNQIHLTLAINRDIEVIWPNTGGNVAEATIQDVIKWEPYPNASKYYVEIHKVEREESTTSYEPIISEVLAGQNSLSLLTLAGSNSKRNPLLIEDFGRSSVTKCFSRPIIDLFNYTL